ncbi:hypothetical protein PG990_013706 [Apiospora arundinis]|uniref:Cofilin/tropomyosin-type actin-binding protein n=1 Tax=Apiospora arundinis TaxID=335852 RepID=A0ABR2IAY7_9PEZI
MSFANEEEVRKASHAVTDDKNEINWLLIDYAAARGDALALTATGTGGLAELAERFEEGSAQYGYVRVEYANDTESKRVKFVFVVWISETAKVMRKAGVSVHSGNVGKQLGYCSIQVTVSSKADLKEELIVKRLRDAGGADYNGGRG